MNIKIPTVKEENATHIYMVLPINYGEEEIPNDFPFRIGDTWKATVEIDTGKIRDWPAGKIADIHLTVKDGGSYHLINAKGENIAAIEGDYVPHGIVPGSYGDTVELKVAADGTVVNWPRTPSGKDFLQEID